MSFNSFLSFTTLSRRWRKENSLNKVISLKSVKNLTFPKLFKNSLSINLVKYPFFLKNFLSVKLFLMNDLKGHQHL